MANSSSQQNTFEKCKKEIIKIFSEIFDYMNDSDEFLRSIHNSGAMFQALINADDVILLSKHVEKVEGIRSVISRDNMKCAFFGRTSNGKSSTINAMLGDRILPADIGHTTSCFIEIRGTTDSQGSVSYISSPKPGSDSPPVESVDHNQIDSVLERARHSCKNKLPTDSLIRIAWPSQKCALLSEDVVILDSPGIDLDPDIDKCIDMYCLDADVFVLVVNSTSALSETEKGFFLKVCEKLSKPNVFILNNFWDKSAKNPNYFKEIREQHMERSVNFLSKELEVCSETEAKSRVFFVSAKEVLSLRSKKNKCESGIPSSSVSSGSTSRREGWQSRLSEFKAFEETLGKSAIKTKFAAHSSQGQEIVGKVLCIVEAIIKGAQKQKIAANLRICEMQTCCHTLPSRRDKAREKSTEDISKLSAVVAERVAEKLKNEMLHLNDVIHEFKQQFSDEDRKLAQYKTELKKHVENYLGNTMKLFWDKDLCKTVETVNIAILERYQTLVQDMDVTEARLQLNCDDHKPDFEIAYESISSDFQGNISRFSWDVIMMMLKYCSSALEAKEKSLKAQFWLHLTGELKPLIVVTSKLSAKQPEIALKATLKRLNALSEEYEQKLQADIIQLKSDIHRLEEIVTKSNHFKDRAVALQKDLKGLHAKYIIV